MILVFIALTVTTVNGVIQLESNTSVPFLFDEEYKEDLKRNYSSMNIIPFMEEEDKMYPRRWRADDVEETEKDTKQSLEDEGFVVYEEDGSRRPTETVLRHFSRYNNSYLILAPLIARPTTVYRLVVLPYAADDPSKQITLRASMSSSDGGHELTFAEGKAVVGESSELMMKLPDALPGPTLKLRVEAHQGSNLLFINTTLVHPSPDFLTIVIFMARPAFTGDQLVEFRVLLMSSDMLPYQDPVDVFILDPSGYIVKRWVSRIPNTGLIDLSFMTPKIPAAGFWRVRVKAKSQVRDHPFLVIMYYIPRFEIMFVMDAFMLSTAENISGEVQGFITSDALVYGNMTVTLWAKHPANAPDSHYKEITSEEYDYVEGGDTFEFPMSILEGHVRELVGTEIKVEAAYMDHFSGMTQYGYVKSRIISGDVSVKFVEQTPVIFRPGMPLTLSINVAYDDLENVDPEDLALASLKITSSVITRSGGSKQLPVIFIPPEVQDGSESELYFSATNQDILNNQNLKSKPFGSDSFRHYYDVSNYSDPYDGNEIWFRNARYEALLAKETYILKSKFTEFRKTGIFTFTLQIPEDTTSLTVNAVYTDGEGATTGDKIDGISNFNPKGRQLHVTSSTEKGVIGEYAVFHVRTNFPLEKFHYVVLSKGILVHSATEAVQFAGAEGVATLGLAVSREMFPLMTFVAYHVDLNGDLTADSIKIPIELPSALNATLYINQHKDHTKSTVEVVASAPAGTYVAVSCAREVNYGLQPISRLTKERFMMEVLTLEPFPGTVSRVNRQPRNTADPPSVHLLLSGDTEGDAMRTLQVSGLASLSDTRFKPSSQTLGQCEMSLGLLECGDGTCYQVKDICDGVKNCEDGSDEILCQYQYVPTNSYEEGIDEIKVYLLFRTSWWKDLFDTEDGNFAWKGDFIGHGENRQLILDVPKTQDDWIIEGVAVHQQFGIAIISPQIYNTNPPVFAVLEGPTICRRGEQVSIRTALFNSMPYEVIVLVILPESEDFEFIHVEEKGVVDFFRPRTSSGEHHHIVFIPAEEIREVFLPLAIKKQVGTVEVVVRLSSQFALDEEVWEIEVKPEGAPVRKHTSVLMDLKNRALFYEFLNIPVDESPIIQNRVIRRFVAGSPQASLTMSGDVFGPTTEEISVDCETAFNGRSFKSTDGHAFNFGATVWTLHYLRLTNQLSISDATGAFDFLNVQMAGILTRMINGGYKMWHYDGPSVWLTAWVTNLFQKAMLEDWENLIYVDTRVLTDAVHFMIQFQEPNGNFRETEFYNITLDRKYQYQTKNYAKNVTIGLTALVTATIKEVLDSLPGKTRTMANEAIGKAQRFLERSLPSMKDPYDIAITAFALSVIGSSEKDVAVSMLLQMVRQQDGFLYWSTEPIKSNDRVFENNQRTFIQPKEPQEWDAAAIEATSYALLVLLDQEGVTDRGERIVNWLISVRDWDLAFAATSDSVIALRALTEYCYRARLRDVTDLKIDVESSADPDFSEQIRIEKPFVSTMQLLEIPNPWGHVLLTGRGAGQALAQLTVTWGVDVSDRLERPPRKYFSMYVNEYHHQARNKSRITTTVCTSWTATDFSPTSHAAMVEIEVPTGYFLHQPEANKVAKDAILEGTFPEMRDVLCTEAYIYFQFVHIPPYEQCFKYDLHRWHPVANLTRTRSAMVYELFAPEHFEQIILNSTTLSALDICEVCGSYQCPYCMYYSSSYALESSFTLIVISFIVVKEFISIYAFDQSPSISRLFSFRIL